MKKTVFISSTYNDLSKYRKKVWEILEKYDVSIRGMEKFGARKETTLDTCISEVEQSDIYVGIIGFKLGSIDSNSGKSFTQIEYEKALELKKEILIYLMDENNAETTPQNFDFDFKRDKLIAFKSILKERHTIDYFINENNLAEKLDRKFNELLSTLKKEATSEIDEYEQARKFINLFLLAPGAYSNKEIKLVVKKIGEPFSASKSICENFNFEYGKTVILPIKVVTPKIEDKYLEHLLAGHIFAEKLVETEVNKTLEIYAALRFTPLTVPNIKSNFYPTFNTKYIENPSYYGGSLRGLSSTGSVPNLIGSGYSVNDKPYIKTQERIEGEGKIILELKEIK